MGGGRGALYLANYLFTFSFNPPRPLLFVLWCGRRCFARRARPVAQKCEDGLHSKWYHSIAQMNITSPVILFAFGHPHPALPVSHLAFWRFSGTRSGRGRGGMTLKLHLYVDNMWNYPYVNFHALNTSPHRLREFWSEGPDLRPTQNPNFGVQTRHWLP